jgi:hypothetical protein
VLRDQLDCRGESGESYRFARFVEARRLIGAAGNFIYVRGDGDDLEVVYVGETFDLAQGARSRWLEAERNYGATAIYTRLNITAAAREREQAEIVAAYDPPMNQGQLRATG